MLNSVKPHKVHKVKKLQLSWGAATIRFTLRTALFQTPTTLVNASVHLRVFSHLSMRPHSLKCQAPSSCGQPCSWSCNRATPRAEPYEWYSSLQYESFLFLVSEAWCISKEVFLPTFHLFPQDISRMPTPGQWLTRFCSPDISWEVQLDSCACMWCSCYVMKSAKNLSLYGFLSYPEEEKGHS